MRTFFLSLEWPLVRALSKWRGQFIHMTKLDLKKERKDLYSPSSSSVSVVEVPSFKYLMFDGQGAPDGEDAQQAYQTLFPASYKLKFLIKAKGHDYGVMPLEGLWWADDMDDFVKGRSDRWKWIYMIRQPEFVTPKDFAEVVAILKAKKHLPGLSELRLESYKEGRTAQILHIGPFAAEGPNIQKIHDHINKIGGAFDGHKERHHEIYLSDMRKVSPEKMKTVLRQPFH